MKEEEKNAPHMQGTEQNKNNNSVSTELLIAREPHYAVALIAMSTVQ
jgi:hypothetical protein